MFSNGLENPFLVAFEFFFIVHTTFLFYFISFYFSDEGIPRGVHGLGRLEAPAALGQAWALNSSTIIK